MVDFGVYRTAAVRALSGEPLYQAGDGHYQFKYLPAFALAMAPFALVDPEAAKAIWFALSAGTAHRVPPLVGQRAARAPALEHMARLVDRPAHGEVLRA